MEYKILIQTRAEKFIRSQLPAQRKEIIKAIKHLPNKGDVKLVVGQDMYYRLSVGNSRIIYKVEYDIITVIDGDNIR